MIIESDSSICSFLRDYDFHHFDYNPFQRKLVQNKEVNNQAWGNMIFIRDPEFVQKRIAEAEKIKIFNFAY